MDKFEKSLKHEKEKYKDIQVPYTLRLSVEKTLSTLPPQRRSRFFWSWNLTAAVLVVLVTVVVLNSDIPYMIKHIVQNAAVSLSERGTEKNQLPTSPVVPADKAKDIINPYHPVIFSFMNNNEGFSNAQVLGGSRDGKWFSIDDFNIKYNNKNVKAQDFIDDPSMNGKQVDTDIVKGNEKFKFYSMKGVFAEAIQAGDKPTLSVSQASGQKSLNLKFHPFSMEEEFTIGLNGEWNALPRLPKLLQDQKSFSVDIDNDGKEETVRITELKNTENSPGNIDLQIELEKNGIKTLIQKSQNVASKRYHVLALDLNEDGKLEIIIETRGPAGGIHVYEIIDGYANIVLSYDSGE